MGDSNQIHSEILNFLLRTLRIEQKVLNFWRAHPNIFQFSSSSLTVASMLNSPVAKLSRNNSLIASLSRMNSPNGSLLETQNKNQEELFEEPSIQHQGIMYRMIENQGLRAYYYKLINTELYVYRRPSDEFFKGIIYLGHQDNLKPIKAEVETDSDQEVHSFELIQPDRTRQFYFLSQERCQEWSKAILKVIGKENKLEQNFELSNLIGKGRFGKVHRVIEKSSGKEYAVKTIRKLDLKRIEYKTIRLEAQVQEMCSHTHLLGLYQYYQDFQNIYLVQEFMKGGTLKNYLSAHKSRLSHLEVRGIAHQLSMALHFLRTFNIIHRDIKPENILLTGTQYNYYDHLSKMHYTVPEVKLADFGLSTILSTQCSDCYGTMAYAAPQIFSGKSYSFSVDIYSLGSVLYHLLSGHEPFYSPNQREYLDKIMYEEAVFRKKSFQGVPSDIIRTIYCKLNQLSSEMLKKTPERRISLQDLLRSGSLLRNMKELRQVRQTCTAISEFRDLTSS